MFEDSFVSARVERATAGRTRWLAAGSLVLQGCFAAALGLVPMLHPERLAARSVAPTVFVPEKPVLPKVEARAMARSADTAALPQLTRLLNVPGRIPHGITRDTSESAPEVGMLGAFVGSGMGGAGLPGVVGEGTTRVGVVAAPGPKKAVRVSAGVTAGLLLEPIRPVYPSLARAARVSGEVVVAATISPDGRIEGLRVISGPEMLRSSAVEAIRQARYRPFLLNGVPAEVETTITVNFRMGS